MPPLFPLLPSFAPLCVNAYVDQKKSSVSLTPFSLQIPFFPKLYLSASQECKLIIYICTVTHKFLILFCYCTGILLVSHVSTLILSLGLLNCSTGSLDSFFPPFPSYVMENLCLCRQRPFSVVSTGVSDSLPCVFILSHPPPSLMSQDLAYFLQPKQLCLPCVSDSLLPLLSFLCRILSCPCKHFFFSFLCTLLFPLPFCCLPDSLFCSCPSCRMSQPGGMCWRSRLCTIKLLVVFHNVEVSLAFLGRCGCFPTEEQFLAVSMLLTTSALQDKLKSCTLWSQKEGLCIGPVVECGS